ncbi:MULTISPECIES: hypothetical protein [Bradyrhizobium]|uniref:Uncharacterized protein n=2 Tax=Bradyrhizobium TaxID=374 RepID=A0ABY0PFB9_9BRAD|nr:MULTISPECIES: hypothetical protein [Bradyrhizobium]SDI26243.1 hypothetical protein SAMN05444163_2331 [Bradyrhizobium ottawaense]SED69286.1 hypothetical protein SAMN05444171_4836 [Bradyrhizobium lablabi]SHL65985.1 hypothetical protein SAMN05444321_3652 [Bradyrhizobium lablabi]
MAGRRKAIRTLAAAAAVVSSFTLPAYPQGFTSPKKSANHGGPLVEKKPEVDEKAYKAALDRIPVPHRKYDPWGIARPAEPGKSTKKSD